MLHIPYKSKDLLLEELQTRKVKNPAYSLRSFARTLGVSPSYLSLLLSGQRRLTQNKAQSIGRKLAWPSTRRKYFAILAEYETCSSPQDQLTLIQEIEKMRQMNKQVPCMHIDQFAFISDWYHQAILAILTMPHLKCTCEVIAERLNLSAAVCETALQRLQRLGFVELSGKNTWRAVHENLNVPSTPSAAIRAYHKEILRKAMVALDQQEFSIRDFSNVVLTIDPKTLPEAKRKIAKFHKEMAQLLEGKAASQLYQCSVQLFRVDQDLDLELPGRAPSRKKPFNESEFQ